MILTEVGTDVSDQRGVQGPQIGYPGLILRESVAQIIIQFKRMSFLALCVGRVSDTRVTLSTHKFRGYMTLPVKTHESHLALYPRSRLTQDKNRVHVCVWYVCTCMSVGVDERKSC